MLSRFSSIHRPLPKSLARVPSASKYKCRYKHSRFAFFAPILRFFSIKIHLSKRLYSRQLIVMQSCLLFALER